VTIHRQIHNVALVGFMGTGKSSVGRIVARQLNFAFVDTDQLVEARTHKSISSIFAEQGEPAFRETEGKVVAELASQRDLVIAAGGGLVVDAMNLASLRHHALIVCLWASPETIWQRVCNQPHRPLLQDPDPLAKIQRLLAERKPAYLQADILVNTEQRSAREVAQHVIHEFRLAKPGY
jgi:shikimate kinase